VTAVLLLFLYFYLFICLFIYPFIFSFIQSFIENCWIFSGRITDWCCAVYFTDRVNVPQINRWVSGLF